MSLPPPTALQGPARPANVDTLSGNDPWVHRLGGGFEYFRPLARELDAALGISYQQVTVRDAGFTSDIDSEDELGNPLTVSDDGVDDLLTVNFAGLFDRRDHECGGARQARRRLWVWLWAPGSDTDWPGET